VLSTKITKLELAHTWTISRNSSAFKQNVFVRLEHDGICGIGEAAPNVRYGETAQQSEEAILQAAKALCGQDFTQYVHIKEFIDRSIQGQNCARAALDIALMDWVGKRHNLPLYQLFGLDPAQTPVTSFSIGIDTPDVIRQKVLKAADYPILKIKVGLENDRQIIEAVRSVTDKPVRVDANEGWADKETAVRMIDWLQGQNVEFIEQPMPARMLEETAWVRQRVDMPIVADEAVITAGDIPTLAQVYDGINIKLMKAGGIQEAHRMIHVARALGLKVMLGCMIESSVAIAAAAHLSPLADWADLDGHLLLKTDPYSGVTVQDGKLLLPTRPGLGVLKST
jgi:L-alanine-DL-glutamate epimerase-like enolase superfamily enzyme